ncbi:MAG: hypothetical protein V4805_04440 [Pseudomonadota bacterium]
MNFQFKTVAIATSIVAFAIATILFVQPQLIFTLWQVDFSYPTGLVGRRAAAIFIGIGLMLVIARNTEPSLARSAMEKGMACTLLLLATLGTFEFVTGHAGPGILSAVLVEILLALGFLNASRHSLISSQ